MPNDTRKLGESSADVMADGGPCQRLCDSRRVHLVRKDEPVVGVGIE